MRRLARVIGALVCLGGLLACAVPRTEAPGVTNVQPDSTPPSKPKPVCRAPGDWCVWDQQCCSGRCYEDTGCSG
jgi:hypothetical protein